MVSLGGSNSRADGISLDGLVIVGSSGLVAFRWTSGEGLVSLGTLPGDIRSSASDASADGSVIVGSSGGDPEYGTPHFAFRWTSEGGMVSLGTLPGGTHSTATGVSNDGSVIVGWSTVGGFAPHVGFRWTASEGMVSLGALPGGYNSRATAVSGDGSAIVGSAGHSSGQYHAVLWRPDLGLVSLNDYLPTLGINLGGWRLDSAEAISADGRTIVGYGSHNYNYYTYREAWIATLPAPCPADYDGSGEVDPTDITAFLGAWFSDLAGGTTLADFNGSGLTTSADITAFLSAWFAALAGAC